MLPQGSAALPARASRGQQPGERGQLLGAGGEDSRGCTGAAPGPPGPAAPTLAHCRRMGRDRAQEPDTKRREAVASLQTHRTARQPVPHSTNGANPAGPQSDSAPDTPVVPFAGLCARKTRVSGRLQKRSNKITPYFAEKCLRISVQGRYCSWLSGGTQTAWKQQRRTARLAGRRPRRNVSS